ncbi:hypothetical protein [Methylomarinovum caldicuralii]|uniref:hypothetical protein n=1 Tax=Methylomarinovum caldicuralii TaxID=438856 RepID=UPI002955B01D|nr:hypothetical protein [Methylomarinovum caldicuralii]
MVIECSYTIVFWQSATKEIQLELIRRFGYSEVTKILQSPWTFQLVAASPQAAFDQEKSHP